MAYKTEAVNPPTRGWSGNTLLRSSMDGDADGEVKNSLFSSRPSSSTFTHVPNYLSGRRMTGMDWFLLQKYEGVHFFVSSASQGGRKMLDHMREAH